MTSKTVEIQVQSDHLEKLTKVTKPIFAVAELIWNAVDADANHVYVTLEDDDLGGISAIQVSDDGHGIPYGEAESLFSRLGGSWKKGGKKSLTKGRLLHGQEGRGRLRALGIGRVVDWDVVYSIDNKQRQYRLSMIKDNLRRVSISDETLAGDSAHCGVTVIISELNRKFSSLRNDTSVRDLSKIFALYLQQNRDVKVYFNNSIIDPSSVIDTACTYDLPPISTKEETFSVSLEIVEWAMNAERDLFLCDSAGFPLDSTTVRIHVPRFNFTAYLKSDYFSKLLAENQLGIPDLDAEGRKAIHAAKDVIRDHFRQKASSEATNLVQQWQKEEVYPYDKPPETTSETIERQVFDILALNIHYFLPTFEATERKAKKLYLRLLRYSIGYAPAALSRVMTEVLELPPEKCQELAALLDRTTLSHIISASKIITDRLEVLRGLETLVFDEKLKHKVLERAQLQRLLAENTWIFGEQYHLSVDDQSLTEVLRQHVAPKGRKIEIDAPVLRTDGRKGVVDFMFSRNIQSVGSEEREHLIVEIKRPDVLIKPETISQIESYAFAVSKDPRFRNVPAKWVFWAVSTDMDDHVRRKVNERDRPRGMLYQGDDPSITIWVKSWSQIISECRARLHFFSEKLNYTPDQDTSLDHLNTTYHKYLAGLFTEETEEDKKAKETSEA